MDGVFGAWEDDEVGVGVGAPKISVLMAVAGTASSRRISGLVKSQGTPCLTQLPHRG